MPANIASSSRRKPAPRRRAGNQPDILGEHLLAPRTQVIAQRVGLWRHYLFSASADGGGGKRSQLLERPGGFAAGLGAIHHHVIPAGIWSVEPVPVQI